MRTEAKFNSINMVDATQSVHLYYFWSVLDKTVGQMQLCLRSWKQLWWQKEGCGHDGFRHQLTDINHLPEKELDIFLVLTLHVKHALTLFYRELITRPGKFIPEYESDVVKRLCQRLFQKHIFVISHWGVRSWVKEELTQWVEEKKIRRKQIDS